MSQLSRRLSITLLATAARTRCQSPCLATFRVFAVAPGRACHRPLHVSSKALASKPSGSSAGGDHSKSELTQLIESLRKGPVSEESLGRLEAAGGALQSVLVDAPVGERIALLREIAELGAIEGRPYPVAAYFLGFLESYTAGIEALRDGETIADRAAELREILYCFHKADVKTERLQLLYTHIEQDFPRFEAMRALLPMPSAVALCHTMLCTALSSPPAVVVLLRSALREPLMNFSDDSKELRQLKMIEILLRVDFLHTLEKLPPEVTEYLSIVRSLRYYDRDLRRDTALSYQLSFFLEKHRFPSKRHMLGPYALKVCDPEERINFEPVEERTFRPGMVEEPPARKMRHLEAVGWRSIPVHAATWRELGTYEAKAAHVRSLLKQHDLLDP